MHSEPRPECAKTQKAVKTGRWGAKTGPKVGHRRILNDPSIEAVRGTLKLWGGVPDTIGPISRLMGKKTA